jgi:predicted NUDIX family phosphoesterase
MRGGDVQDIKVLGYINDDSEAVGMVHFGVLCLVQTDAQVVVQKLRKFIREGSCLLEILKKCLVLEILSLRDGHKLSIQF